MERLFSEGSRLLFFRFPLLLNWYFFFLVWIHLGWVGSMQGKAREEENRYGWVRCIVAYFKMDRYMAGK